MPLFATASEHAADSAGLSASFALVYPMGLVTIVIMVQLLPKLMGDDLAQREAGVCGACRAQQAVRLRFRIVNSACALQCLGCFHPAFFCFSKLFGDD